MITWRWVIVVAIVWGLVIVLDELTYRSWKVLNPGSQYTGVLGQTAGLVDPANPPTSQ